MPGSSLALRPDAPPAPWGLRFGRRRIESASWLLVVEIGFAAWLHALTRQSLWPDEVSSLETSRWSLVESWNQLVHDHVPLYPLVLGWWSNLAGTSQLSLRYLSAIFATVSVALLAPVARRSLPSGAALAAVGVYAISPFQLSDAQEVVTDSLLGAPSTYRSKSTRSPPHHPPGVIFRPLPAALQLDQCFSDPTPSACSPERRGEGETPSSGEEVVGAR